MTPNNGYTSHEAGLWESPLHHYHSADTEGQIWQANSYDHYQSEFPSGPSRAPIVIAFRFVGLFFFFFVPACFGCELCICHSTILAFLLPLGRVNGWWHLPISNGVLIFFSVLLCQNSKLCSQSCMMDSWSILKETTVIRTA